MKVDRKLELATQAVTFLTSHDDASVSLRNAALDRLVEHIERERAAMGPRKQERDAKEAEAFTSPPRPHTPPKVGARAG